MARRNMGKVKRKKSKPWFGSNRICFLLKKMNATFNLDEELEKAFALFRQRYLELNNDDGYDADESSLQQTLNRTHSDHGSQTRRDKTFTVQPAGSNNRTYNEQMIRPLNQPRNLNKTYPDPTSVQRSNQPQRLNQTQPQQRSKSLNRSVANQMPAQLNQTYTIQRAPNPEDDMQDNASIGSFAQHIGQYQDEIRAIVDQRDATFDNRTFDISNRSFGGAVGNQTFENPMLNQTFSIRRPLNQTYSQNNSQPILNQTYTEQNSQRANRTFDRPLNETFSQPAVYPNQNRSRAANMNATFTAAAGRAAPMKTTYTAAAGGRQAAPLNTTYTERHAPLNTSIIADGRQQAPMNTTFAGAAGQAVPMNTNFTGAAGRAAPLNSTFTAAPPPRNQLGAEASYESFVNHMEEYKTELRNTLNSTRKPPQNDNTPNLSEAWDSSMDRRRFSIGEGTPNWTAADVPLVDQWVSHPSRNLMYDSNRNKTYTPYQAGGPLFSDDEEPNRTRPAAANATMELPASPGNAQLNGYMTINDTPCFGTFSGYVVSK